MGRTDEWYTPPFFFDGRLGVFDLDPCAPENRLWDSARHYYTKEDDGLSKPWFGRVWLNPPYRNPLIRQFVEKMAKHNRGVALVFNRMDTALWHEVIFPTASAIRILKGRLRFYTPDGREGDAAGCGSVLISWGADDAECLRGCNLEGKFISLLQ